MERIHSMDPTSAPVVVADMAEADPPKRSSRMSSRSPTDGMSSKMSLRSSSSMVARFSTPAKAPEPSTTLAATVMCLTMSSDPAMMASMSAMVSASISTIASADPAYTRLSEALSTILYSSSSISTKFLDISEET